MSNEILGKELIKENYFSKKNPWLTLAKDVFFVSLFLFLLFSWFEWRSPDSVSDYFEPGILFFFSLFFLVIYQSAEIKECGIASKKYLSVIRLIFRTEYLFLFFLAVVSLGQFFKLELITSSLLELSILAIILGTFTFYQNKNEIRLITKESDQKRDRMRNYLIVFAIFILFLITKLFFITKYPGNFADDWQHIIAGSTFFENGHFHRISTQFENGYLRGSYVSFTVAVFFYLFGKTLFIAKLVPAFIGSINFFIFYFITKKIIRNTLFVYLGLIVFTFNVWTIFNHLYIRTYVFFELFLLLIIFIFIKIIESIKNSQSKKIIIYFIVLILINYLSWFWSYDANKYPIWIASLIGLTYLFFFEVQKIKIKGENFLSNKIKYLKNLSIKNKFYLWFSFALFFTLINIKKIQWIMKADAPGFRSNKGYFEFFFEINIYLMILYALTIFIVYFTKNTYAKITFLISVSLLIIHFSLNPSLQVVRGILYFIPLFILTSIYSLDIFFKIIAKNKINSKYFLFLIIILLGLTTNIKNNFPKDFFSDGPSIKKEIGYADYSKTYQYLKNNHPNKKILQADYNIMSDLFFDLKTSYKIDFNNILKNGYTHEYNKELERNFQIPTQTPTIIEEEEFYDFISKNETCIIARPVSKEKFFTPETWDFLEKNFKKEVSFNTFTIYCN